MDLKLICVATAAAVVAISSTAFGHEETRQFDDKWDTAIKQEDFDGMPLPETSDLPTVTQVTPAIVKVGNRYGVPYQQYLGKKKHGPGKKDDYMDHMLGASLVSGGTLISLGALAMVIMASKALLFAFGAIAITCLSAGWLGGGSVKSGGAAAGGTVYEVVAKPQITHGHSYSSEVHHEPYPPQPYPNDYSGYGYGHGGGGGVAGGGGYGGGGGGGGYNGGGGGYARATADSSPRSTRSAKTLVAVHTSR